MKKFALVTGASKGIGRACALLLAQKGYFIFLNCRKSEPLLIEVEKEILSDGGHCKVLMGDVGNSEEVAHMFAQIHQTCVGLDVLVNNAGIAHIGLLTDMTDREWNRMLQTNLSSVFYCSRSAVPNMVQRKEGRIINVSSMWGNHGASCEAAYSATKAGVNGLTKALAKELAPSNIQVNAIAFGVIDTEMNGQLDREERASLADEIPAGRFASAKEAAEMIWNTLKSPAYMTGQVIGFDGGF